MKEIMKVCPLPITTWKCKNEAPPPPHPFLNGLRNYACAMDQWERRRISLPIDEDGRYKVLRVSCPSILTALKIEGDRFSIHSTAMTEDSFSLMLIITLICLFTRYGVVKIQSLSSHNNAASFTKGFNNLGADEGSTFCDLVIRYHLVKKLSSDENVRNEKKFLTS